MAFEPRWWPSIPVVDGWMDAVISPAHLVLPAFCARTREAAEKGWGKAKAMYY
jgi:hypothetical protein